MHTSSDRFLEFSGLSKSFPVTGSSDTVVVENFDLRVSEGEFVCLVGASGCGKSTLLSLVAGLDAPTAGVIDVADGVRPALMFQDPALFPWLTVEENVADGLLYAGVPRRHRIRAAREMLAAVGLSDRRGRRHVVHELEVRHRRSVTLAGPDLHDPRVAAGPVGEARRDLLEERVRRALRAEKGDSLPVRRHVAALAERDHLLDDRPYLLGLGLGGPDAAVLDQRAGEVRIERLPMSRVPAQLPACALMLHSSLRVSP